MVIFGESIFFLHNTQHVNTNTRTPQLRGSKEAREKPRDYPKASPLRRTRPRAPCPDVSEPARTSQLDLVLERPPFRCLSCHWRYCGAQRTLSLLIVPNRREHVYLKDRPIKTIPPRCPPSPSSPSPSCRMVPGGCSGLFPEPLKGGSCSKCQGGGEDPGPRSGARRTLSGVWEPSAVEWGVCEVRSAGVFRSLVSSPTRSPDLKGNRRRLVRCLSQSTLHIIV